MAPTRFSILLDNPMGSYFPGQVIAGRVILVLEEEKNSQGLKLKFTGEAHVAWQESQGQTQKGYRNEESYFSTKIVLVGDERGSDISIPAGSHEYPFTFQLPLNLPSSFESQFGYVRYEIEATVKRAWKFDYTTKTMFTVNALLDLNLQPVYAEPREAIKEKSICCLCCKEGPISMRIELPRSGYVPGEMIKFSVYANNSSSRSVSAIVAYLTRDISYRAHGRSKHLSEELVKLRGPEVKPFLSETWQDQLQIPPIPPSNLGGCKIIEITYLLKFKLDIPSSIDLKKKIPLLIGTIPFTNFLPNVQQIHENQEAQLPHTMPDTLAHPFPLPALLSQYPGLPSPFYQDAAAFGRESVDEKESVVSDQPSHAEAPMPGDPDYTFVPKYATYNYGWKFHLEMPDKNGLN